jgi:hypothetical protein
MDCIIDTKIGCPDLVGALSAVVLVAEAIAGGRTPISRPAATAPMIGKRVISVSFRVGMSGVELACRSTYEFANVVARL